MNEKIVLKKCIPLYLITTVQLYAVTNGNAICLDDKNNPKCCTNYAYNADEDRCVECVGRFGINCSEACPDGSYGTSCNSHCNCSKETCHKIWGCLGTRNETDGICYDKENGSYCCVNYMYLKAEHICQECVGRFGINCSKECPRGFYGKQCNEECSCEANYCDQVLGCLSSTAAVQTNGRRELEMSFPFALSASLSAVALLVVIALAIAYRFTNKHITETSNANNSTQEDNEKRDTSDIYATVVHPTRKPLRGIQQNDMTYDNTMFLETQQQEYRRPSTLRRKNSTIYKEKQTVENFNFPYSMCIGLEDAYDDNVCIPSSTNEHGETIDTKRSSAEDPKADYSMRIGPEDVYDDTVCIPLSRDVDRKSLDVNCSSMDNNDVTVYDDIDFEGDCSEQNL